MEKKDKTNLDHALVHETKQIITPEKINRVDTSLSELEEDLKKIKHALHQYMHIMKELKENIDPIPEAFEIVGLAARKKYKALLGDLHQKIYELYNRY